MSGFRINGCGAKDYFKKVKYLGEQMCPNCKMKTPFYLEKGEFKVSVFWIPTVTLKERYAIMCEVCEEGKWIEDATAYSILNGNADTQTQAIQQKAVSSSRKCPKCGAEMEGAFCGKCGAKYTQPVSAPPKPLKICSNCGAEVFSSFCGKCGTKYWEQTPYRKVPLKTCSNCGAEVEGDFCGKCGMRFQRSSVEPIVLEKRQVQKSVSQEWKCYLCGTSNPQNSNICSLCGCEKR